MKSRSWLIIGFSLALCFSTAFALPLADKFMTIRSPLLRGQIHAISLQLKRLSGWCTDRKFELRGVVRPKSKIIIAAIDNNSIERLGRWPWHRDTIAKIIEGASRYHPKVIGIDLVAPRPDPRVGDDLRGLLKEKGLENLTDRLETDPVLIETVKKWSSSLVLPSVSEHSCQPAYSQESACRVDIAASHETLASGFERFAIPGTGFSPGGLALSPLFLTSTLVRNFPALEAPIQHLGLADVELDYDGVTRSTILTKLIGDQLFPSFALETARLAMSESIQVQATPDRIESILFTRSSQDIPISSSGELKINFRGPTQIFPQIAVEDLIDDSDRIGVRMDRSQGLSFPCPSCRTEMGHSRTAEFRISGRKDELLRDAIILVGVTAPIYDMKPIPFGANTPGVIGHANIIDNLMAGDALVTDTLDQGWILILLAMSVGALIFAVGLGSLPSALALTLAIGTWAIIFSIDYQLFKHHHDWNTIYLYLEFSAIAVLILINRYTLEEGRRKFLKEAFSRFVSPQVVKTIIDDPRKLALSGEKRQLSILFSDIRDFMPFSSTLHASALHSFLNEYHSLITRIVVEHGTLDKYIGDNVMAFWGAPLDQPTHALNACRAALQIVRELEQKNPYFRGKYGQNIRIGIGINSGPVIVGNMGSEQVFSYTAIGDDVNLASRVERLTRFYGVDILVTRATLDAIRNSNETVPPHRILDQVIVKGSYQIVEIAQLLEKDYPTTAIADFVAARKLYSQSRWDEAIARFHAANEEFSRTLGTPDLPCRIFIARCQEFKINPPPPGWDGSFEMTTK